MTRSPFDHLLGRFVPLEVRRFGNAGAFLAEVDSEPSAPTLLLLGRELATDLREGDQVSAFVYLDSEGRPLATTAVPKLALGEVAFLRVMARTAFGAFVDWGLPKELLVPLKQQTQELHVGALQPIGLVIDDTGRLAGTMRVTEMLSKHSPFDQDEWVVGEAWRRDPEIGLFVIVERSCVGLLPRDEPHTLARGDSARFRVTNILPDGKMELSLRAHAHEALAGDAEHVLAQLLLPGAPQVSDRSSPERIRQLFGLSKKAFKRAIGRLLKEEALVISPDGYFQPTPLGAPPKAPASPPKAPASPPPPAALRPR